MYPKKLTCRKANLCPLDELTRNSYLQNHALVECIAAGSRWAVRGSSIRDQRRILLDEHLFLLDLFVLSLIRGHVEGTAVVTNRR